MDPKAPGTLMLTSHRWLYNANKNNAMLHMHSGQPAL
jgi:hypothetical protein